MTRSALGNAVRAIVMVHGRAELHLKFNNRAELEQAYRELDALEGKLAPSAVATIYKGPSATTLHCWEPGAHALPEGTHLLYAKEPHE